MVTMHRRFMTMHELSVQPWGCLLLRGMQDFWRRYPPCTVSNKHTCCRTFELEPFPRLSSTAASRGAHPSATFHRDLLPLGSLCQQPPSRTPLLALPTAAASERLPTAAPQAGRGRSHTTCCFPPGAALSVRPPSPSRRQTHLRELPARPGLRLLGQELRSGPRAELCGERLPVRAGPRRGGSAAAGTGEGQPQPQPGRAGGEQPGRAGGGSRDGRGAAAALGWAPCC